MKLAKIIRIIRGTSLDFRSHAKPPGAKEERSKKLRIRQKKR